MKSIQQSLMSMLKEHSAKRYLSAAVGMIAIATVLAVVWSLHINGITLASDDPTCGQQEHEHTADCYDWVTLVEDGTEGIDSTEGTEAIMVAETTESVEATELTEATEFTVTTESAESAATAETEDETNGVSVSAEDTETSVSASWNTEENTGVEGTESVTDDTEAGTEALMEGATEDATEGVTEETTESPQPGDTKVVNGVTYVYELVCGLEEHVHTDECYPADESEDDVDASNSAEAASDSEDFEDTDADGSTSEDRLDETTDDEEIVSSKTTRLMASSTEEEESEEDIDSGIATINEEDTESGTILTATATEDAYYFADVTTLDDAAENQGESYIVYTIIDSVYYVVLSDGSLVACTEVDATASGFDLASATKDAGMYCINYGNDNISFKYTVTSGSVDLSNYLWEINGVEADGSDDGSGTYTFYNAEGAVYLAPENVDVSETITGNTEDSYWWTSNKSGKDYYIEDGQKVVFTITCSSAVNGYAAFNVELYDTESSSYGSTRYITTGSDGNMWTAVGSNETYDVEGTLSGMLETLTSAITENVTYTVTIERTDSVEIESVNGVETEVAYANYTITYYDVTNGSSFVTLMATNTNLTADSVNVHIIAQVGSFDVSEEIYILKSAVNTTNDDISSTYSDVNNNTTFTTTQTSLDYVNQTYDKGDSVTLDSDFDVTYTFENYNPDSNNSYNYVLAISNGNGKTIYISAAIPVLTNTVVAYENGVQVDFAYNIEQGEYTTHGTNYRTHLADSDVTINIKRVSNTFTIDVNVTYTSSNNVTSTVTSYILTFSDEDFDECDTEIYLTGLKCTLSNIAITDDAATYDWVSYDTYAATGSVPKTLSVNASGTGFTASSYAGDANMHMSLYSTRWANWTSGSSGTTFYLAMVRQSKVYFDGTNGGGTVYRENTSAVHHVDVVSYEMDNEGTKFYVTVPSLSYTPYYANSGYYYDYELIGWYDIYNSNSDSTATSLSGISSIVNENYYEPGDTMELAYDSSTTGATITVCYADYIGTTYDAAIDSSTGAAYSAGLLTDRASSSDGTGGVNTDNFVTTYVYDYSDIFNLYSAYIDSSGATATTSNGVTTTTYKTLSGHQELWKLGSIISGDPLTLGASIFGSNVSYGFIFFNNAATENSSLYYLNRGTNYENFNGGNTYIRIADITTTLSTLDVNLRSILFPDPNATSGGAWHMLSSSNGTITDTVDKSGTMGTTYVGEGNYLYQYDENTGYYYYDAADNAAFYSITDQRFYLYDYTVRMYKSGSSAASTSDFLPFNYAAATYTGTDEDGNTYNYAQIDYTQINYAFGMKSEIEFVLPDNVPYEGQTVSSSVNQNLGRDMKFCFMGDDDLWVYIDEGTSDEILLDIGGIHGEIYGEVNFSTGVVGVVDYLSETIYISDSGVITCKNSRNSYTMTEEQKITYADLLGTTTEGIEIFIEKTDENLYEITDLAKSISWVYTETYIATNQASRLLPGSMSFPYITWSVVRVSLTWQCISTFRRLMICSY